MPTQGGDYMVEVSFKNTGCATRSDLIVVNESAPPKLTPNVVSEAFARSHIIEVNAVNPSVNNPISEYEFSINGGFWELGSGSSGSMYSYTFDDGVKLGSNTIIVRDIIGCGETKINVIVMDYPLYFTPNGDGFHDTWNIIAPINPINYLLTAKIRIFNRYGKFLKEISAAGNGWDGLFNGKPLPTDDYWFLVDYIDPLDNAQRRFKAHFALKR